LLFTNSNLIIYEYGWYCGLDGWLDWYCGLDDEYGWSDLYWG
jgi:hypothetical protein